MKTRIIMAGIASLFLLIHNILAADLELKNEFSGSYDLIEDIDGDGKYEFEGRHNDTLYIYDIEGIQKYVFPGIGISSRFQLTEEYYISPIDMNNDGIKDIILTDTTRIVIYDFAHQSMISEIYEPLASNIECVYLRDIDSDNIIEMIVWVNYDYDSSKTRIYSTDVSVSVSDNNDNGNQMPVSHKLAQNYPNPFNPTTIIGYQVQRAGHVKLSVYNALGQRVNTLVDKDRGVGEYSVQWNGKNESGDSVASGIYFYQLEIGDFVSSKKMVMLK